MRNEQYGNKLLPKQSANEYAHCKSKMLLPKIIWLFYNLDMINYKQLQHTPSPWLTRICFTLISLTRIFKKIPFLA